MTQPVEVTGNVLPSFNPDGGQDPAVGADAPTITGTSFDGTRTEAPAKNGLTVLVFVAHWCPHCQAEVPEIVAADIPDDVNVIAVSTGHEPAQPNWPPDKWLEREGWPYPVIVDDKNMTAATSYGITGLPYIVAVEDGTVIGRTSGSLGPGGFQTIIDHLTDKQPAT